MPKVSVIVPVYGVEKYIERCARSLFEQTLDDIEYLFIDDCTPDRSIEILKSVLEEYPNRKSQVTIHRMEQNSGQAAVRKLGMLNATGDYIIHCDSDDWVDVDMYRAMYEKAEEGNYDMVVCDYFESDGSNHREVQEVIPEDEGQLTSYILTKKTHSVLWNKLIKHSVYDAAQISFPKYNNAEDWATLSQLAPFVRNYASVKRNLYYWYFNPESITRVVSRERLIERFNNSRENIQLTEAFFEKKNLLEKYIFEFDFIKTIEMQILLRYINEQGFYNVWRVYSRDIKKIPLFNRCLNKRDKLRYYAVLLKLYPILKKLHLI